MVPGKPIAALLAATIAVGVLALTALASVEKKGFKVGSGATEGGSVACKSGQTPTGGGFELEQTLMTPNGPERLGINSAYPDGKRWKVAAYNFDGSQKTGAAIVLCEKDDGLFVRSKAENPPKGNSEAQATAKCPRGSKALGGGGNGPKTSARMRGSFPGGDGRSWGARFENVYGDKIEAFVVCDKNSGNVKVVEDVVIADPPRLRGANPSTVTAKAECAGRKQPVGGGQFATNPGTYYRESRPADGAWKVVADAPEGTSVVAYAVCR